MIMTTTYALPHDVEESINDLLKLKAEAESECHTVGDIFAYTDQMSMLLSELKIAAMNGQISQEKFEELKGKYIIV